MKFESNVKLGRSFINYAHGGASFYAPQNTMLSFMLGLSMGANGIETAVQKTKDGQLVLFFDDTLNKAVDKEGKISDYNLCELKSFWVSNMGLSDKIVTLDEFLSNFSKKKIYFTIQLKNFGIAREAVDKLFAYGVQDRCVIMASDYDILLEVKKLSQKVKTGYITIDTDDNLIKKILLDGIDELCLNAKNCNLSSVKSLQNNGIKVSAWGILDEELMKSAYDSGTDGMMVNFPDKLVDYIGSKITVE